MASAILVLLAPAVVACGRRVQVFPRSPVPVRSPARAAQILTSRGTRARTRVHHVGVADVRAQGSEHAGVHGLHVAVHGNFVERQRLAHRPLSSSVGSSVARAQRPLVAQRGLFTPLATEIAVKPKLFLGTIAAVVCLSSLFERWEHRARHRMARVGDKAGLQILNSLFAEFTCLGFISLSLFAVSQSGVADFFAARMFQGYSPGGHMHNPLTETFELVHIAIFMLLVVLLVQAAAVAHVAQKIRHTWSGYESIRAFGEARYSIESMLVEAGYLERELAPEQKDTVIKSKAIFRYGRTIWERLMLRRNPLHKLLMWRAIRQEFLFPSKRDGKDRVKSFKCVADPALFSFVSYLRGRLSDTVLALIKVDVGTWFLLLLLLTGVMYARRVFPWLRLEVIQCSLAWFLAGIGGVLCIVLEEDTYRLTPHLPEDPRKILRLFAGTSVSMLRRLKMPAWSGSARGRRFRPDLGDGADGTHPTLESPVAFRSGSPGRDCWPSSAAYREAFRILAFFQAICITSLIISQCSTPPAGSFARVLHFLAWLEWPLMLFYIVPTLIRRLTVRNSIEFEKDELLIRQVSLESKEALLRDVRRLIRLVAFERFAAKRPQQQMKDGWTKKQSRKAYERGRSIFDGFSDADRTEFAMLFATWDPENDGIIQRQELVEILSLMGFEATAATSADSLIEFVDFDGGGELDWNTFRAIVGLAASEPGCDDWRGAMEHFFCYLDADADGLLSLNDVAEGFQKMRIGLDLDDIANVLYLFFGKVQPTLTKDEFMEWMEPQD